MARAKKRGRPIAPDWVETNEAAAALGIRPEFLLSRRSEMKAGVQWRVKNPRASRNGRRYLWKLKAVEPFFVPEDEQNA